MKKIITLLTTIFMTVHGFAQAPQTISYQAIIRNSSNALVVNTQVGMRISILQGSGSSDGIQVYSENQTPTTNANGLVSIAIGSGATPSGNISMIDWSAGPYFIKTEIDPTGGTHSTISGTSQLMSVPYALYAANSGNAGVPYTGAKASVNLGAHDLTVNGITVGLGAGSNNSSNSAIGNTSLANNTTGINNTANGAGSLQANTTGSWNTASGTSSLQSNTTAYYNTAYGADVLQSNTTGFANTASGSGSMQYNTTGFYNTASGASSLYFNTIGDRNTAIGFYSLQSNKTGSGNTANGFFSLGTNVSGTNLTAIGNGTDVAVDGLHNATAIGANAIVDANNKIQLGDSNVTNVNTSGIITAPKIGIGTNSPNSSAALDVTSTIQGFLPPRMTVSQRDAISNPAQGLMLYCTNCGIKGEPEYYDGTSWVNLVGGIAAKPITIGMPFQGGIVAYILVPGDPGYVEGQTHGLIAATTDQSSGIQWFNGSNISIGTSMSLGTGLSNTDAIIAAQGTTATTYAAGLARAYNGGGYTDWYLPSIDELYNLYLSRLDVGGFTQDFYWSSSESLVYEAWGSRFGVGSKNPSLYRSSAFHVRAIRSF